MPTTSTARNHRNQSQPASTDRRKRKRRITHTPLSSVATTLNNSNKSNVSQNFVKSSNIGTDILNDTKINRYYPLLAKVRYLNEEVAISSSEVV
jgi:hypothetical protein